MGGQISPPACFEYSLLVVAVNKRLNFPQTPGGTKVPMPGHAEQRRQEERGVEGAPIAPADGSARRCRGSPITAGNMRPVKRSPAL